MTDQTSEMGSIDPDGVPQSHIDDIEAQRRERLHPDNRPDGAEVDNTHRVFDPKVGMFTDSPGYDPSRTRYK